VAQLPQWGVECGQLRHGQPGIGQGGLELTKKLQRMIARIHERE